MGSGGRVFRRRLGEKAVVVSGALEMVRRSDDSMVSLASCWMMGSVVEVAVMVTSHISGVRNGMENAGGKRRTSELYKRSKFFYATKKCEAHASSIYSLNRRPFQ